MWWITQHKRYHCSVFMIMLCIAAVEITVHLRLQVINWNHWIFNGFKYNRKILCVKEKSELKNEIIIIMTSKKQQIGDLTASDQACSLSVPYSLVCSNWYNDGCYVHFYCLQPKKGRRGDSVIFLLLLCFSVDREPFENDQKHGHKWFLHANDMLFRFISLIVDMVSDSCVCLLWWCIGLFAAFVAQVVLVPNVPEGV